MKTKTFLLAVIATAMGVSGYFGHNSYQSNDLAGMVTLSSVEAISDCESVGWWNNDGNCVKNSNTNEYFCKDDGILELTDCIRSKPEI